MALAAFKDDSATRVGDDASGRRSTLALQSVSNLNRNSDGFSTRGLDLFVIKLTCIRSPINELLVDYGLPRFA
jgi:hypothetical protein